MNFRGSFRSAFQTRSCATRRRLAGAVATALLALAAADAGAQHRGRLEPDQREQLRSELRERGARADWARPSRADDGDDSRMSPQEREQLRRQLRDARPDDWRHRGRARGRD